MLQPHSIVDGRVYTWSAKGRVCIRCWSSVVECAGCLAERMCEVSFPGSTLSPVRPLRSTTLVIVSRSRRATHSRHGPACALCPLQLVLSHVSWRCHYSRCSVLLVCLNLSNCSLAITIAKLWACTISAGSVQLAVMSSLVAEADQFLDGWAEALESIGTGCPPARDSDEQRWTVRRGRMKAKTTRLQ